jgi:RNA polymerase sigma factor (TIGR02999 family)
MTAAIHDATQDITQLLARWQAGDAAAEQRVLALVYPTLRAIARRALDGDRLTLQPTELVNEAYLRLAAQSSAWANREHFLALYARIARRVVIDLLRRRDAVKRGGGKSPEPMDDAVPADTDNEVGVDWRALESALADLRRRDAAAASVVELRYFADMNNDEIAAALGLGVATVVRHWRFARAWLHARLVPAGGGDGSHAGHLG